MEKALEILNRYHHGIIECNEKELDEAIAELEAQLKAKDEEIEKLKKCNKGYLIVLNDKLDRNNFLELQVMKK